MSTQYALKYNSKHLDLTRSFRQSGLVSGAKLELVLASRSPAPVSVALQLPTSHVSLCKNGRLTEKFSSDTTIWLILRRFESFTDTNLNITARGVTRGGQTVSSGNHQILYEMPVLNVMGRELSKFEDFQKTLRQLGFNGGTCLIKLEFKKTEQSLEEAMRNIQDYFSVDNNVEIEKEMGIESFHNEISTPLESLAPRSSETDSRGEPVISQATSGQISEKESISKCSSETTNTLTSNVNQHRPIDIYAPPSGSTPKAATIPYSEADFQPTIAHAKLHQTRLLSSTQNKRLLSDVEKERLEREKEAKLSKISKISIKIRFPDQSTIVSSFNSDETGIDLYQFTSNLLEEEGRPFKLSWHNNGPQIIPRSKLKLVADLGFQSRMLVNFLWDGEVGSSNVKRPVLKSKYNEHAKEVVVPSIEEEETLEETEVLKIPKTNNQSNKQKVVGKWFKGLTKK